VGNSLDKSWFVVWRITLGVHSDGHLISIVEHKRPPGGHRIAVLETGICIVCRAIDMHLRALVLGIHYFIAAQFMPLAMIQETACRLLGSYLHTTT
jgi:hypothetical protein